MRQKACHRSLTLKYECAHQAFQATSAIQGCRPRLIVFLSGIKSYHLQQEFDSEALGLGYLIRPSEANNAEFGIACSRRETSFAGR